VTGSGAHLREPVITGCLLSGAEAKKVIVRVGQVWPTTGVAYDGCGLRVFLVDRPPSYFRVLSERECILDVDAEVAHRALDLAVTQRRLHRSQVADGLVDDRCLGPAE
jgi:hypothetical protein